MKSVVKLSIILLSVTISCSEKTERHRDFNFNQNWKFSLDEYSESYKYDFDDADWRSLNLPHDWSVEFPFDSVNGEGCTAYLPGGIGWYRKHFISNHGEDENVYIVFDGVYNNSKLWINGEKLGEHPYGYSPFFFDLTEHLNGRGKHNVLAVKVDHSRYADSRWYSGSGIYRDVKLVTVNKLHIPVWGSFITTPEVNRDEARVTIQLLVENNADEAKVFRLNTTIFDSNGKEIASTVSKDIHLENGQKEIRQSLKIQNPDMWGIHSPSLYTAITNIIVGKKNVDTHKTRFGIRSIRWDHETGFYLNDENMKIKGVCLHHDGGLVGAAVPKGVWKRRLEILKEAGCNAVRMSHNPASDEFLDLCDEMGILVQDEFFDEWDYAKDKRLNQEERHDDYISRGYADKFQDWSHVDLKNTILAHRNHPSVFQWSIGNEIEWTYPRNRPATGFFNASWSGNYFWSPPPHSPEKIKEVYESLEAGEYEIGKTAQKLAKWTKELDTTRPVIANCILPSASFVTGYADALDIVGFSYRRVMYDYARERYPNKIVMGTENLPQWHEWKAIEERPFISGTFLWTGIDYMGERNNQWPTKTLASGLIDQAGFPNPSYHMYKTLWQDEPCIYLCTQSAVKSQYKVNKHGNVVEKKPGQWETRTWFWYPVNEFWNYKNGEAVIAEVISNCEEVELFLDDQSLGTKYLSHFPDRIYKWALPYKKGKLVAVGKMGSEIVTSQLISSGTPVQIKISADKKELQADGQDVSHIIVQLLDKNGHPVKHLEKEISFKVNGVARSLGVDNGNPSNVQDYQASSIKTHEGRAMLIIQSGYEAGKTNITVSGEDLDEASVAISVKNY